MATNVEPLLFIHPGFYNSLRPPHYRQEVWKFLENLLNYVERRSLRGHGTESREGSAGTRDIYVGLSTVPTRPPDITIKLALLCREKNSGVME